MPHIKKQQSPLLELLAGKVTRGTRSPRKKSREIPPQELPRELQPLANLFAAARTLEKEVSFKAGYAKQKLDEFCVRDFVHRYVAGERRPSSREYTASHSRFKFVITSRTTLTADKTEALRELGFPIDEHTELRGLEINYDAIRQHKLENKLRQALEALNVPKGVLDEVFLPNVELKENFYDQLLPIVRRSLGHSENIEAKLFEVLQILNPATQVRNTEVTDLDVKQCFDLLQKTELEVEEEAA